MKELVRKFLAIVLVCGMIMPASLSEEVLDTAEYEQEETLVELPEETEEPEEAEEIEAPSEMYAVTLTASALEDGDMLLTATFNGEASAWYWQRMASEMYAALDEEAREAAWESVEGGTDTLRVPDEAYTYRAIAESEDGLYVSEAVAVEAAETGEADKGLVFDEVGIEGPEVIDYGAYLNGENFYCYAPDWDVEEYGGLLWYSTDPSVLSVVTDGNTCTNCRLIPMSSGYATVCVYSEDYPETKSELTVTVLDINGVAFSSERLDMEVGDTESVTLQVDTDGSLSAFRERYIGSENYEVYVTPSTLADCSFNTDTLTATVTAKQAGSCQLHFKAYDPDTHEVAYDEVCVIGIDEDPELYDYPITLSRSTGTDLVDIAAYSLSTAYTQEKYYRLHADWDGYGDLEWSVSNTAILKVDAFGPNNRDAYLIPIAQGKVTVRAAAKGDPDVYAEYELTVYNGSGLTFRYSEMTIGVLERKSLDLEFDSARQETYFTSDYLDSETGNSGYTASLYVGNESCINYSMTGTTIDFTGKKSGMTEIEYRVTEKRTGCTIYSAYLWLTVVKEDVLDGVHLDTGSNATIDVNGGSATLYAYAEPSAADSSVKYSWKVKQTTEVVTISPSDSMCVVTPKREGTCTITVTAKQRAEDGTTYDEEGNITEEYITKTATVTLTVADPLKPTSVTLVPSGTASLQLGTRMKLEATVLPETSTAVVTYSSSSTKVATVDANGVVTGLAEGNATITATATYNKTKKTAKMTVKVTDLYKPSAVALDYTGTVALDIGTDETLQLTPILSPANALAEYTWTSSKTAVADVDENGLVTPVAPGSATITVTATRGSVKKTATVKVTVTDSKTPTAVTLNNASSVTLDMGNDDTLMLEPSLTPAYALATFTYTSSKTTVAKVDDNGCVVPTGTGKATITVTATRFSTKKTVSMTVNVVDSKQPTGVTLDHTGTTQIDFGVNETLQLAPILSPSNAAAEYTWTSSRTSVAVVDQNGLVTPCGTGTATITVTATRGSVKKTASCKVQVIDSKPLTNVSLNYAGTVYLPEGYDMELQATQEPYDTSVTYTWKSSATKYATVTGDDNVCKVHGEKIGSAKITVTAKRGTVTKTATVTVKVVDPNKLAAVALNYTSPQQMYEGDMIRLRASYEPAATIPSSLKPVWSSSNSAVADVDSDGWVYAKKAGSVTITAKVTYGGVTKSVKIKITVKAE